MTRDKILSDLADSEAAFAARAAEMELTVRDPDLDVEGFVCVWSTVAAAGGPLGRIGKGGTRITPTLTLDEVRMLARTMTLKNAGAGLPLGGAKSGLRADPNAPDFERKYRRFVELVKPVLAEHGGPFGGFGFDIGGRPEHALWACDTLGSTRSFTGKPVEMGGTDYDREGVAGYGVAVAADALLRTKIGRGIGRRFSVQGVGALGAALIRFFAEFGGELVAVSDPRLGGTFEIPETLPTKELLDLIAQQRIGEFRAMLENHMQAQPLEQIFRIESDIFFPCAVQDVIDEAVAAALPTRLVVEGANNPTTTAGFERLAIRGIPVIPGFIANPGGIIAAFVELTSTVTNEENARTRAKVREAKELTNLRIRENVTEIAELSARFDLPLPVCARYVIFQRLRAETGK